MVTEIRSAHCVTKWSIENLLWEGVSIKLLAEKAKVKPEATWVMFHCLDGYTAPVPLEDALKEDSIVALKMNGKPLLPEQGFPAGRSCRISTSGRARSGSTRSSSSRSTGTATGRCTATTRGATWPTRSDSRVDGYKPVPRRALRDGLGKRTPIIRTGAQKT